MEFFVDRDLQKLFQGNNEHEVRKMIEVNRDKTRISMQINLDPEAIKELRMMNERIINEGTSIFYYWFLSYIIL